MSKIAKNIILAVVAILLIAAIAGLGAYFFRDVIKGEQQSDEPAEAPNEVLVMDPATNDFVKLTAITLPVAMAGAEQTVQLTATVLPENLWDKRVDWAVSWQNPLSEWATGKIVTEYVTVTPAEDGALVAEVNGLKAFGEQVVITCASRVKPEIKAVCTVDYMARYRLTPGVGSLGSVNEKGAYFSNGIESSAFTINAKCRVRYNFGYASKVFPKYLEIFEAQGFTENDLHQQCLSSGVDTHDTSSRLYRLFLPLVKKDFQVYESYSEDNKVNFYKKFFTESSAQAIASNPAKQNSANAAIREWLDYIANTLGVYTVFELKLVLECEGTNHEFYEAGDLAYLFESFYNDDSYKNTIANIKNSIIDAVSDVELSKDSIVF